MNNKGKLYICGTPIGNLDDITYRAIDILKKVDLIAAEDTRRTGQLLNQLSIKKPMTSYHEHNEKEMAGELLQKLENGKDLALVSDAGMPGISDPGLEIIKLAVNSDIEVIPIPGPTAAISALVVSGLPTDSFVFEGFVPRKGKERTLSLKRIQREERTVIIYESPYRLKDTLEELLPLLKGRQIVVARELTKVHEEKIYGTCSDVLKQLKGREVKGEIVIIVEGKSAEEEREGWEDLSIVEHVEFLMKNGYTKKKAIKEVARLRDLPKSEVYQEAVVIDATKYLD